MAVNLTDMDIGTRYALQEDFNNGFVGRDRQVVIQTDDPKGYRPVIMDGTTQGGKNKVALVDDLSDYVPVDTYNSEKAGFATKGELSSYETKTNASATYETKANASATYATKSELTSGLSGKADSSALTSLIPKTGARGQLAGYESITEDTRNLTITALSPDDQITSGTVTVSATSLDGISWTKTVLLTGASPQVSLDPSWTWVGGSAPTLTRYGLLVLAKRNGVGIANFIPKY